MTRTRTPKPSSARGRPKRAPTTNRPKRSPAKRRARGFRLTESVRPISYDVHLSVDPVDGSFEGEVTIQLRVEAARLSFELHAADLKVERATWQPAGGATVRARVLWHKERESVELRLPTRARAGVGSLVIRFSAPLQEGLRGLYGARVGPHAYAFTQLEAADARRFFPCFDEPAFKARFTFSVTTDAQNTVLSNSPAMDEEIREDGRKTTRFAPTPNLSTYLCALAVGPLEGSVARMVGETPVRVWHSPGKAHLTEVALEAAASTLVRLERYFGIAYPYAKLDLVAVPDFEAGAMENAGAVFFRETLLLADPKTMTLSEHKRLAEVVAHELAHMWFGNLVTMAWWNDLWLNEAFATWMAFRVVDEWKPEWKMWNNFEHFRASALNLDALVNTHPIYCEVRDVAEATENFDAITYEKGAAVVRMVEHYLGSDVFREGVRLYIERHRDGNATAQDLWRALGETSGKEIESLVRSWIESPGFPLLTIAGDQGDGPVGFDVRQERFYADRRSRSAPGRRSWPVPLIVKYRMRRQPPSLARYLITKARDHVFLDEPGPLEWYYANADEGGFFRVRHAEDDLDCLAAALPGALTAVERMGLLDHQWAMVRNGAVEIESFLKLVDRFDSETDHDVLDRLSSALSYIEDQLLDAAGPQTRDAFSAWIERRFMPQLIQCGWDPKPAESDDARLRRGAIVRILGEIAQVPAVCSTATARAARYLDDRKSLDANLVDTSVIIGARNGDSARFERYRAAVREARTPQERRRFQLALAAFRVPELIERTLALTLTDEVPTQDVALVLIRAFGNPAARERAWRFITRRWEQLRRRLPPMMIARVIEATPALQTKERRRDVAAFFRQNPVPTAKRSLQQALERFDVNEALRRRAAPGLSGWLAPREARSGSS